MKFEDFEAWVTVDGVALEEHGATICPSEDGSENRMECWIPSEAGKKFVVNWKCWSRVRKDTTAGWVFTDGIYCGGRFIPFGCLGKDDSASRSYASDNNTTRDFLFSNVQLTDEDEDITQPVSKYLGEIHIKIQHGTRGERSNGIAAADIPTAEKIHERLKNITTHRIGFAEPVMSTAPRKIFGFRANGIPPLSFVFKYRPLGVLQANGVAPPMPTENPKLQEHIADEDKIEILDGLHAPNQNIRTSRTTSPSKLVLTKRKAGELDDEADFNSGTTGGAGRATHTPSHQGDDADVDDIDQDIQNIGGAMRSLQKKLMSLQKQKDDTDRQIQNTRDAIELLQEELTSVQNQKAKRSAGTTSHPSHAPVIKAEPSPKKVRLEEEVKEGPSSGVSVRK
ncbi:hypothetical protein BJ138DRAFT_620190 [Hygrophoropsis aurantiaca]|uniref:Uncharacterized protein n=1 Tax=Hygrophoropsis aurantiaca TaxID=72124 RepID=A0ACB8A0N4_9AGAM|nr:hypothetical protein BJ138DRAFT_620190 [Hygrophoropsis aurantiaca]